MDSPLWCQRHRIPMRSLSMAGLAVFAGCLQVFLCLGGVCFARSTKTTGSNLELCLRTFKSWNMRVPLQLTVRPLSTT